MTERDPTQDEMLVALRRIHTGADERELIAAMLPYLQHKTRCATVWDRASVSCDCGFDDLVTTILSAQRENGR